jgi:CubicO group peptidase (beta-lactamase class C family)
MSSGLDWKELGNVVSEYNIWVSSPNQVKYMLDKPLVTVPGQVFHYNTGAIHFLSVIIGLAGNMKTNSFAQKYLFDSLEIGPKNWLLDKQGYNNGGAGLYLTPADMIKIGNLILNKGEYKGKKVVSSEWINQSTKTQISTNNILPYLTGYGYGLWTGNEQGRDFTSAMGWGGQYIVVFPSLNLVISATCNWQGISEQTAGIQWTQTIDLIMKSVFPAFN